MGTVERDLGALAQLRARRPGPGEHQDALRAGAASGERLEAHDEGLRAPGTGLAEHQERAVAVIDDAPLRRCRRVAVGGHSHTF